MAYQKQWWSDDPADNTPISAARLNHMEDGIANIDTDLEIEDGSITTAKLANSAVTGAKIANNAVTTAKISDLNVTTGKLAGDAVTATKIAASAVTTDKIANLAVTSAKIAANSITSSELAGGAVQATHIQDLAITGAKIANGTITSGKLGSSSVGTTQIANLAVTAAKIASNSVTGSELASNAVSATHINSSAVTNVKIANETIQGWEKLAPNSVPGSRFVDDSVTIDKLHPGLKPDIVGNQRGSNWSMSTLTTTLVEVTGLKQGWWHISVMAPYTWPGHPIYLCALSLVNGSNSAYSPMGGTSTSVSIGGPDAHRGALPMSFVIWLPLSSNTVRLRAALNDSVVGTATIFSTTYLSATFVRA